MDTYALSFLVLSLLLFSILGVVKYRKNKQKRTVPSTIIIPNLAAGGDVLATKTGTTTTVTGPNTATSSGISWSGMTDSAANSTTDGKLDKN